MFHRQNRVVRKRTMFYDRLVFPSHRRLICTENELILLWYLSTLANSVNPRFAMAQLLQLLIAPTFSIIQAAYFWLPYPAMLGVYFAPRPLSVVLIQTGPSPIVW